MSLTLAQKNNRAYLVILICLVGLALLAHVKLFPYAFDDAYIHFRVARNLIENGAPYYNPGEAVKVSTSSGWTVFLAIIYAFTRWLHLSSQFPLIVGVLNSIFTICGMLIYTKILSILINGQWSPWVKVLFQVSYLALFLPSSIGLMETSLALLIAGLGILFILQSKPIGFIFLGLMVYFRIELIILLFVLVPLLYFYKRFKLLTIIAYSALGFLPLIIYDLYFFHTLIPQSIHAKSIVYALEWYRTAAIVIFNSLPQSFLNIDYRGSIFVGIIFLSVIMLTTIFLPREWKENRNIYHLAFYSWGMVIISIYIITHAYIFDWYMPLYILPFLLLVFLFAYSTDHSRKLISRFLLGALSVISILSLALIVYSSIYNPGFSKLFVPGSRVKVYLMVGKMLNVAYPRASLLSSEIGGLGYSFEGRIIDAAGLASPEALKYHPLIVPEQRPSGGIGAIPTDFVKETYPDLIVSYDIFSQALRSDAFINNYNSITIPAFLPQDAVFSESKQIWNSEYLRIFIRKDLPIPDQISDLIK